MTLRCFAILVCLTLSACGQKGDLYHPEEKSQPKTETPQQPEASIKHESLRLDSDRPLQQDARTGQ